ncbi:sigma 54-interacting transcriptional regulator [candidate division KSB1 bacterium]|nr:sigma 54-interacting transcriptional regulator [candidate division KSB1 bacterium]
MLTGNIQIDELWQGVLDTVAEGIVIVEASGFVNHINAYAAKTLQIDQSTNRGRHFSDVFCPGLPIGKCWVNQALHRGEILSEHKFNIQNNNHEQCALANFTPIKQANGEIGGAIITLRLIDETHILRKEHDKKEALIGSLAEGLFTVDFEWRITSFNRAAERITGWREEEVVGKYCNQIFRCDGCIEQCPIAETLRRAKPMMDSEMEIFCSNGQKINIIANTSILYNTVGEVLGGIMSFRDSSANQVHAIGTKEFTTQFHGLVGKNKKMQEVFNLIQEISDSHATVLILGKSGTGKELVANAIQQLNDRRDRPFVKVNCAAIPDALLESELMGHVKGAFTDAQQDRIGRFELAHTGTIFLDEVGDLTPAAQMRLLRILEQGEFQRLGSSRTQKIDVRVIAATNRDLWEMVQEGTFREDLYYRLNVIPVYLPPLSERMDDLPLLIEHFITKYRILTHKQVNEISDQAWDLLMAYTYPGNVRELENIIEHAFARTKGHVITANKLPFYLRQFSPMQENAPMAPINGKQAEDDEAENIRRVLQQCHWNRSLAAKNLGMSRTTLWRRMRELDLIED